MKMTGRLEKEGFAAFQEKPEMRSGRRAPRIWAVVADEGGAKIFRKDGSGLECIGIAEPEIPVEIEMSNKTTGRVLSAAGGGVRNTYQPSLEKSRQHEHLFSQALTDYLEEAENADVFDRLVLVAAPRMLGDLRGRMAQNVKARMVAEVDKDLTQLRDAELQTALEEIFWF